MAQKIAHPDVTFGLRCLRPDPHAPVLDNGHLRQIRLDEQRERVEQLFAQRHDRKLRDETEGGFERVARWPHSLLALGRTLLDVLHLAFLRVPFHAHQLLVRLVQHPHIDRHLAQVSKGGVRCQRANEHSDDGHKRE